MAKLIIINGPSGVGKSTVAERLHQDLALSLLIDVDQWRRFLSAYWEQREESLALAYDLALAAAEIALKKGKSVIVEKIIVDAAHVIDALEALGRTYGAEVYEIILTADKIEVLARADARGYKPGSLLTPARVAELWDKVAAFTRERPQAVVVDNTKMTADQTYARVKEIVSA